MDPRLVGYRCLGLQLHIRSRDQAWDYHTHSEVFNYPHQTEVINPYPVYHVEASTFIALKQSQDTFIAQSCYSDHRCGQCGIPFEVSTHQACTRCQAVFYCSVQCQRLHCETHRMICKLITTPSVPVVALPDSLVSRSYEQSAGKCAGQLSVLLITRQMYNQYFSQGDHRTMVTLATRGVPSASLLSILSFPSQSEFSSSCGSESWDIFSRYLKRLAQPYSSGLYRRGIVQVIHDSHICIYPDEGGIECHDIDASRFIIATIDNFNSYHQAVLGTQVYYQTVFYHSSYIATEELISSPHVLTSVEYHVMSLRHSEDWVRKVRNPKSRPSKTVTFQ